MTQIEQAKIKQAIGILQSLLVDEQAEYTFVGTFAGAMLRDQAGKLHKAVRDGDKWALAPPEPDPEPDKPKPEVVWPEVDYSNPRYTIGTCKTCVSYYSDLFKFGFPGFVAEIRKFWGQQEGFYQPIKDFIRDYPELFPKCETC
jgi:hypothetical protein